MLQYLNMWTTVGASGSIYGILLAFAMMFPNERLFVIPFPFPIKAKYFVLIFGALELVTGLSPHVGDNVAHFAHLGGMLFGIILILIWRKKNKIDGPYNF
jgi:membrane associated rhomboid family serine protease